MRLLITACLIVSSSITLASCPEAFGPQALLSSNRLIADEQQRAVDTFCVYGIRDGDVAFVYSLHKLQQEKTVALTYPPAAEGLGVFSESELQFVVPQLVDLNFDGHLDVSLLAFRGGTGNQGYNYWVFDPDANEYRYNETLSGRAVSIDPTNQVLTASWVGGHAGGIFQRETFRWIENRATLVYVESRRWNNKEQCYTHRIQERRNDSLVESHLNCEKTSHEP